MGSQQIADKLVYQDKTHPQRNYGAGTTDDERYLILSGNEASSNNNLMIKNLKKAKAEWKTIVADFENEYSIVDNDSNSIYMLTNKNASNYRLVKLDAENPAAPWKDILPGTTEVLEEVVVGNNLFVARYMKDAHSLLKVFDKKGKFLYDIPMETVGTVDQLSASKKDPMIFYSLNTFTAPSTIYKCNLATKENSIFFRPKLNYNPSDYETKQVFYPGKDGTKIPMFIVHKKGVVLNGTNPTLLFGYGGFNLPQTPVFKVERLVFMENGGVFALANIRGGSEYGEKWHEAGTKLQKQNVFNDFIAAAEYLIAEKYTSSEKLGINGRSNGGLLVGAVMTQRPELFRVAIPTVGVMDMLRYHTFTIGWAWKGDYGSSEDEANFRNLYAYSPLHNIKENVNYPATLVTTGDHDDRVVPAHSFKFISTLQEKYKGNNPVLIRIDVNAGHAGTTPLGSSKPIAKQIEEQTDIFSFLMFNLGMTIN
ncbi:MAG: S9 family peptidase [Bacteroidetes bacterium]|nr:S9 family peptidase [Bacteroidota bacterium]